VSISTGLETINEHAFINCTSLKSFDVEVGNDNFKSDGGVLFDHDGKTLIIYPAGKGYSYTVPDDVESIASYAFENCTNLTSVTIPSTVKEIGSYAFYHCTNLQFLYISTDATSTTDNTAIGEYAFYRCTGLTNVTLGPNAVIGASAFSDCSSLKNVNILPGVTTIGESAFNNCDKLKSIDLPSTITSIGSRVFYDCDALTSIVIPPKVTQIPSYFCYGCSKLKSVGFSSNVTVIGNNAFMMCTSLSSVTLPPNLTEVGSSAFAYGIFRSIDIPASVTNIGSDAFAMNTKLTSVTYHGTTNPAGYYYQSCFGGCSMLLSVCVPSNYSESSFCRKPVCKTDSCDSIYSQDNQCFGTVCNDGNVTYEIRPGVSDWEQTYGCVDYYCNNATGLARRGACWNDENGTMLCESSKCVMKAPYMDKLYLVAIDMESNTDMYDVMYFANDLAERFGNSYYYYYRNIAYESNEVGDLRVWVYSISSQSSASTLANSLNRINKDNCNYYVLCNVKHARVYDGTSSSDPTPSSSTKPHSSLSSSDTSTSSKPVLSAAVSVHEKMFGLFVALFLMLIELINYTQ